MTTFDAGSVRFYSTLEEAKANKPTDPKKASWDLHWFDVVDNRDGSATKGQVLRVYGWTGGKAVLGWQIADFFQACVGGKAEGRNANLAEEKAKLDAERAKLDAERAALEEERAKLQAELQALRSQNQQPTEEPTRKTRK